MAMRPFIHSTPKHIAGIVFVLASIMCCWCANSAEARDWRPAARFVGRQAVSQARSTFILKPVRQYYTRHLNNYFRYGDHRGPGYSSRSAYRPAPAITPPRANWGNGYVGVLRRR
jgi:hypothetical protein